MTRLRPASYPPAAEPRYATCGQPALAKYRPLGRDRPRLLSSSGPFPDDPILGLSPGELQRATARKR
jgi:hypothetical protein